MRVALAAVLFSRPDLLLLDEPTNYLDLEGTLWLENFVQRYPYTVLVISHDRDVLNNAVNAIVHLDQKKLNFYRGDYDQFERQRAEKLELLQKSIVKQEAAKKHMEAFVERFRAKASKARQAQSRLKALERMSPIQGIVEEHVTPFVFDAPEKQPASPIIAMEKVAVGYQPGRPILQNLDIRIDTDDRIALLGQNGNGKSTFAKLLAERLKPEAGAITRAPGLKIAFFAQHQIDDLRPAESAVQHVRRMMPDAPEAKVRAKVAQMGLPTMKMDTAAEKLSGGEKARLLMGLATLDAPNLLILDEPTNHLDIEARESLVRALNDYPGAVILISHDRHMVEATMDRLWIVGDGTVSRFDGDLEDYKKLILSGARTGGAAWLDRGGGARAAATGLQGRPAAAGGRAPGAAEAAEEEDQPARDPDLAAAEDHRGPRREARRPGALQQRPGKGRRPQQAARGRGEDAFLLRGGLAGPDRGARRRDGGGVAIRLRPVAAGRRRSEAAAGAMPWRAPLLRGH